MAGPSATTSYVRAREVEAEGGKETKSKPPPQSVNQDMSSDCRKSAIPRGRHAERGGGDALFATDRQYPTADDFGAECMP